MSLEVGDTVKIKGQDSKVYTIIGAQGLFFQLQAAIDGAVFEVKRESDLELVSKRKRTPLFGDSGRPA